MTVSPNVAHACGWCGGGTPGARVAVYATAHGHAEWCPKHNRRMYVALALSLPEPKLAGYATVRENLEQARRERTRTR